MLDSKTLSINCIIHKDLNYCVDPYKEVHISLLTECHRVGLQWAGLWSEQHVAGGKNTCFLPQRQHFPWNEKWYWAGKSSLRLQWAEAASSVQWSLSKDSQKITTCCTKNKVNDSFLREVTPPGVTSGGRQSLWLGKLRQWEKSGFQPDTLLLHWVSFKKRGLVWNAQAADKMRRIVRRAI